MYFDSFSAFIDMGGHGFYVWIAYASFVLIFVWNLVTIKLRRRKVVESARRYWLRADAKSQKVSVEPKKVEPQKDSAEI